MESNLRRTYQAPTLSEAIAAMRAELGPDAIFVEKHKIRKKSMFGIGCGELIEVVAELPRRKKKERKSESGIRPDAIAKVIRTAQAIRNSRSKKTWVSDQDLTGDIFAESEMFSPRKKSGIYKGYSQTLEEREIEPNILLNDPNSRKKNASRRASAIEDSNLKYMKEIRHELDIIKKEICEKKVDFQNRDNIKPSDTSESSISEINNNSLKIFDKINSHLLEKGISKHLADSIITSVSERTSGEELNDCSLVLARIKKEITGRLKFAPPMEPLPDRPLIVMAIGSTGVGKTTTLAKLGAIFCMDESMKIVFITLDRYRIAASEQLRTYSEIIGAPFEEANDEEELSKILDRHVDKDFVFIDTAGCSVHKHEGVSELKRIAERAVPDAEILLLVSSNTDNREMAEIIRGFSIKDRVSIVFTKTDETFRWGPIYNAAVDSKLPIAYLTTGQSVPYDIEPASPRSFITSLMEGLDIESLTRE